MCTRFSSPAVQTCLQLHKQDESDGNSLQISFKAYRYSVYTVFPLILGRGTVRNKSSCGTGEAQ